MVWRSGGGESSLIQAMPIAAQHDWTFFTNHSHVLVFLASHPDQPLRVAAEAIGITERAVQRIVAELEESGVVQRERVGRSNRYTLRLDAPLRHPLEKHCTIGDILGVILDRRERPDSESRAARAQATRRREPAPT